MYQEQASHNQDDTGTRSSRHHPRKFRKICAKLSSGVRFGIGVILERSCGPECDVCTGEPFHRQCRYFNFKPHYLVKLGHKAGVPQIKVGIITYGTTRLTHIPQTPADSYDGFRSDFIHMSVSLESSLRAVGKSGRSSSFHLNPQVFAHFWSWWTLFDRTLSLQVRQGKLWPDSAAKIASPKLGRHLATLKYRIVVPHLFLAHVYVDDSQDAWEDGLTPFVGVKALIDHFQVDLHQREEETTIPGTQGVAARTIRRKPFDAVEAVLKGLDLRAMLAIFAEPLKRTVPLDSSAHSSAYRSHDDIPVTELDSPWVDFDDFVEADWIHTDPQTVHILPAASCPQFTYFKRANDSPVSNKPRTRPEGTKFGEEDTHVCLQGTGACE
jgi:hypothetical protein